MITLILVMNRKKTDKAIQITKNPSLTDGFFMRLLIIINFY